MAKRKLENQHLQQLEYVLCLHLHSFLPDFRFLFFYARHPKYQK